MKIVVGLVAFVMCSMGLRSQIIYESPYVYEGETFQVKIPKGFYSNEFEIGYMEMAIFLADSSANFSFSEIGTMKSELLVIMHQPTNGETLEEFGDKFDDQAEVELGVEAKIISEPKIKKIKGREFFTAGVAGNIGGQVFKHNFISATVFGDYFIIINAIAFDEEKIIPKMKKFKSTLGSFGVLKTEKENTVGVDLEDLMLELDEMSADTTYVNEFENDLYDTRYDNSDIWSNSEEHEWNKPEYGNSHLLASFELYDADGYILIFSGGLNENYPSDSSLAVAFSEVFEMDHNPKLEYRQLIKAELGTFVQYEIIGEEVYNDLYTLKRQDELLFFVTTCAHEVEESYTQVCQDFIRTIDVQRVSIEEIIEFEIDEED